MHGMSIAIEIATCRCGCGFERSLTIVPVLVAVALERELRDGGGGDTGTGVLVAQEATVAATVDTGVGAVVLGEVAAATTPDATGLPVIGDLEGHGLTSLLLPSGGVVRDGFGHVQVSEQLSEAKASASRIKLRGRVRRTAGQMV